MIRCRPDRGDQVRDPFELVALGAQAHGSEAHNDVPSAGSDVPSQALEHLLGGAGDDCLDLLQLLQSQQVCTVHLYCFSAVLGLRRVGGVDSLK